MIVAVETVIGDGRVVDRVDVKYYEVDEAYEQLREEWLRPLRPDATYRHDGNGRLVRIWI